MKKIIITITASIAVTVSVTLVAVNIGEISIFTKNITYNITNSRSGKKGQKDRNRKPETDRNKKPKSKKSDENIKTGQDTTQDTTKNEEELLAEEDTIKLKIEKTEGKKR